MLCKTFCHVQGIGRDTERSLWQQGCPDWDSYLSEPERFKVGSASRETVRGTLEHSKRALDDGVHQYFAKKLGLSESWRAWPDFRSKCVYLDIETDGRHHGDAITMVGLYNGEDFQCLIKDQDLDTFPDVISQYSLVVTFFGSGFDLPMLKKKFPNAPLDQIHIDLCPLMRHLGFKGGLKKIERQLGIGRPEEAEGLSGLDAIRLWSAHLQGKEGALEKLVAYNREDVVNLETLLIHAYLMMSQRHWLSVQPSLELD